MSRSSIIALLAVLTFLIPSRTGAQIVTDAQGTVNADSVREAFDNQPYFGLYKDNYFKIGRAHV